MKLGTVIRKEKVFYKSTLKTEVCVKLRDKRRQEIVGGTKHAFDTASANMNREDIGEVWY